MDAATLGLHGINEGGIGLGSGHSRSLPAKPQATSICWKEILLCKTNRSNQYPCEQGRIPRPPKRMQSPLPRGGVQAVYVGVFICVQVTTLGGGVVWAGAVGAESGVRPFSHAGSAGSAPCDAGFGLLGQRGGPEDGVGVNILPDNVSIRRDLEDAPRSPLADQRVAVWQPLRATDVVAVEGDGRCTAVLPGDSIGLGVHLKNS